VLSPCHTGWAFPSVNTAVTLFNLVSGRTVTKSSLMRCRRVLPMMMVRVGSVDIDHPSGVLVATIQPDLSGHISRHALTWRGCDGGDHGSLC
jgi:hypothetical protein